MSLQSILKQINKNFNFLDTFHFPTSKCPPLSHANYTSRAILNFSQNSLLPHSLPAHLPSNVVLWGVLFAISSWCCAIYSAFLRFLQFHLRFNQGIRKCFVRAPFDYLLKDRYAKDGVWLNFICVVLLNCQNYVKQNHRRDVMWNGNSEKGIENWK